MFRDTGGVRVMVGAEPTWGHFVIEPKVELGPAQVLDDVPTVTVPQAVPGLRVDAILSIQGEGTFRVAHRMPAQSPGETILVLRGA